MNIIREDTVNGFLFSTDKARLDLPYIHSFLTQSYWSKGVPMHVISRSIENSLAVGIYHHGKQIGFARVITDHATFGYLADVFVDQTFRGQGVSKSLMRFIFSLEGFESFRRILLATKDAHGLYAQFGFKPLKSPDKFMEIHNPDIYTQPDRKNI